MAVNGLKTQEPARKAVVLAIALAVVTACGVELDRFPSESSNQIVLETVSDDYALPTEGFPDQLAKSREVISKHDPSPAHRYTITGGTLKERLDLADMLRAPGIYIQAQQAGDLSQPLAIRVQRTVAIPPSCGDWEDPSTHDYSNLPPRNYGCADQSNLARMVANPEDLIVGRSFDTYEAERTAVIIDSHRNGRLEIEGHPRTTVTRDE